MRNKVLLTQYRVKKRVNLTDRIFIDRLTALFPNDRHVAAAFFLLYQPKGNGSIGQLAAVRIQRAAIGGHFNVLAALQDKCRNIGTGPAAAVGLQFLPNKMRCIGRIRPHNSFPNLGMFPVACAITASSDEKNGA